MAFAVTFGAMLLFQLLTLPSLRKKFDEDNLWGFYMAKFVAFPLWFAFTFAGPLGIIPGVGLALLVTLVSMIGLVVLFVIILKQNPHFATEMQDDVENNPTKQKFSNYYAFAWGSLLLAGSLGVLVV